MVERLQREFKDARRNALIYGGPTSQNGDRERVLLELGAMEMAARALGFIDPTLEEEVRNG